MKAVISLAPITGDNLRGVLFGSLLLFDLHGRKQAERCLNMMTDW